MRSERGRRSVETKHFLEYRTPLSPKKVYFYHPAQSADSALAHRPERSAAGTKNVSVAIRCREPTAVTGDLPPISRADRKFPKFAADWTSDLKPDSLHVIFEDVGLVRFQTGELPIESLNIE